LIFTDIEDSIEEIKRFYLAGGNSIVDLTSDSIGRDPEALRVISRSTGINIIMGSGRYIESSLNESDKNLKPGEIAKQIIKEFENGVRDTGIKPGIIGEVGISEGISNKVEVNSLRAAAKAQNHIGCGLSIHPPIWEKQGGIILDILMEENADIKKVVLCHCDPTLDDYEYHDSMAKKGCFIEFDMFGLEIMTFEGIFLPSDGERIRAVKKQIDLGNIDNILISGDLCFKIVFSKWGGWGYGHILNHIVPRMKKIGITEEEINKIIVDNPRRLLSF
jgi:phosphotriesterase-related protein